MVEGTDAHLNDWALEFLLLNVLPLSRKGRMEFCWFVSWLNWLVSFCLLFFFLNKCLLYNPG
jgi:hypothetical protein